MAGFWNYLKQLFRSKSEQLKDPEIEIEQVITEARGLSAARTSSGRAA